MTLYFITGNERKFREVKELIPEVEQLNIDLPEIQSLDPKEIIEHKLEEAIKQKEGQFIVEDTSLFFDSMNGLPGPLIKWFLESVGNKGLAKIAKQFGDKANGITIAGYYDGKETHFFEGKSEGKIVEPTGSGFGWDEIFVPDGYDKTFAELGQEEKNKISMRSQAFSKLRDHLKGV